MQTRPPPIEKNLAHDTSTDFNYASINAHDKCIQSNNETQGEENFFRKIFQFRQSKRIKNAGKV